MVSFTHIIPGYLIGAGIILKMPQHQWQIPKMLTNESHKSPKNYDIWLYDIYKHASVQLTDFVGLW